MDSTNIQQEVRDQLLKLGFGLVRFTSPPLGKAGARFSQWLEQGFAGEMAYLNRRREERLDPSRMLKDIQSLIVVATDYDCGLDNTRNPSEANLSRYAWGDDYHEVIGVKLKQFQKWLKSRDPDSVSLVSIDASPVLEKGWAERAGLGWLGKHTNIIHEDRGSYFFLSVILTNLEFTPDAPVEDRCGTCTRCIDVCPTRAIVAPYVLDARLCISYQTIENKGPIPRELRPLMGNHVFGCDDCQEVCPWNRFSRLGTEAGFQAREELRNRPLIEFLDLDEAGFKQRFANSPVLRPKRRGFLRNVLVAIGNSGRKDWAEKVREKFSDPEPLIRGHAVWAYDRLLEHDSKPALLELQEQESDPFVMSELRQVLNEPTYEPTSINC